jgi:hypothetical protein
MSSQRRSGLLLALTVVSLAGWFLYSFADPCVNPCRSQGDIEGRRCRLPDCVWVSTEKERFAGRYCLAHDDRCRTHSAGNCNHQVDVFCKIKEYRCVSADGTACGSATERRELGVGRTQPTLLDCQGHRCRGPGSFITPTPVTSPTSR